MIGQLFGLIGQVFKPAADLIDNLHTSEEERLAVKNELFRMQAELSAQVLQYEQSLLKAKAEIIQAEAQGASWMQRSWRPITMLTFLALVVCDSFGWLANPLAAEAWTLLQIGLGGYVVGRSAEKLVPKVTDVMRKD
jgi:hypothetical protein